MTAFFDHKNDVIEIKNLTIFTFYFFSFDFPIYLNN